MRLDGAAEATGAAHVVLIALVGVILAITTAASRAHPFVFDTSTMPGFNVLTAEDNATKSIDMVVIEYNGPIAAPMAENLRSIWEEIRANRRFNRVVVRLNSPGGSDLHGERVIAILNEIREHAALTTVVGEGDMCASMCVAVYIQGETRYASSASTWMFHGACRAMSNIPSLALTHAYFEKFAARAIDVEFINFLFEHGYVTSPGAYWLSGKELAERSNIITDLIPNWRPVAPNPGPAHVIRGGI